MQGHLATSTHQHHIQIPGYYPVGNDFMPPSFGPFFGTPDHGRGTQPGNPTQSFDANPKNMFFWDSRSLNPMYATIYFTKELDYLCFVLIIR